jgi:hypothetical protein
MLHQVLMPAEKCEIDVVLCICCNNATDTIHV